MSALRSKNLKGSSNVISEGDQIPSIGEVRILNRTAQCLTVSNHCGLHSIFIMGKKKAGRTF